MPVRKLPSADEIRQKAVEMFYATLPPELRMRPPTTPEDYELKETGLWYEAQRDLMSDVGKSYEEEFARWEEMTEPEKVELRNRVEAFKGAMDELEKSVKAIKKKLPPPPKPPRAPAVRAPPPPLEFVCPRCGQPLMKVTEIDVEEHEAVEVSPGRFEDRILLKTQSIPPQELIFMCAAGKEKELGGLRSELKVAQEIYERAKRTLAAGKFAAVPAARREMDRALKDWTYLSEQMRKLVAEGQAKCPFFGLYFYVSRGRMVGPVPKSEVLRRIPKPREVKPPTPSEALQRLGGFWPFKGGPKFPEIKKGMTDEQIKAEYEAKGIHVTDEGAKFIRERYGV